MIYRSRVFGNSLIPRGFIFVFLKCYLCGGLSLGLSVNEILLMVVKFFLLRKWTFTVWLFGLACIKVSTCSTANEITFLPLRGHSTYIV